LNRLRPIQTGGTLGGLRVERALGFVGRMLGLLGGPMLQPGQALHLSPCKAVHTVGMRYPIDVVFLDRNGAVLKVVPHLQPWRAAACWRAHGVLELSAGQARVQRVNIRVWALAQAQGRWTAC
jgi:uncharacterized membrane protein (UPF0127 family)